MHQAENKSLATRIALYYALFGLFWILTTDYFLVSFSLPLVNWAGWQTAKGLFFVLFSTLLVLLLIHRARSQSQEMQATLRLQSAALQAADDAIVITGIQGDIQWANPAFTRLTGYATAEVLGKNPRDLIRSGVQDAAFYKELWNTILAGRVWRGELVNRRKDDSLYTEDLSITPVLDEAGDITHFVAIKRDISPRIAAQKKQKRIQAERQQLLRTVQTQARQLRQIMDTVPEGLLFVRADGVVPLANPRARDYLSRLAGVGVGDRLAHLGGHPLEAFLSATPRNRWHEIDHEGHPYEIAARPLEAGDVPYGWTVVIRDVADQRLVQRQLQHQARLAAVGQMAAGIAHDFNNIMGVILLQSQLLESAGQLPQKQKERLDIIGDQANRASHLIQQILDFSRRATLERRQLDLLALLKEEVRMLQRTLPENIETTLSFTSDRYVLQADAPRMQQVIMNLALNARDAMSGGGRLQFELATLCVDGDHDAPLPGMDPGPWIRLDVRDTGAGIAPRDLDKIFEPFFSTKDPGSGTGLGLAQVHGIVTQHGGFIIAASTLQQGTTFTLYLPALSAAADEPAGGGAETLPRGQGQRLLIVEDESSLRQALAETLQLFDYDVLQAADGEEALELLAHNGDHVALVLSDLIMPHMGGLALRQALRDRGWDGPIILMTGHASQADLDRLPPGQHPLHKPISPSRLTKAIHRALNT